MGRATSAEMPADSFLADFIAGWVAGGTGLLLGHPLDTIKVRLQALKGYSSPLQCVKQTFRQEAIGGFYKGMLFPFMTAGFLHSIYFGGHGVTLKLLKGADKDHELDSPFVQLLTGSIVGASFQWIPACPIEIVKTKLQVQKETKGFKIWQNFKRDDFSVDSRVRMSGQTCAINIQGAASGEGRVIFTSPWDCLLKTVRHEGISGLYRGGLIMLLRDVVGFCFYLPVYENLKYLLTRPAKSKKAEKKPGKIAEAFDSVEENLGIQKVPITYRHRLAASLVAGGFAGVASWFTILPLDLIKSRLQADDIIRPKYQGILHCARESFQKEGLTVFFRGWQVVLIRAVPVNAVLLLCYDEALRFLSPRMRW